MANPTLRFKRGTQSAFSSVGLSTGEPAFITDEHNFYIGLDGNSNTNKFFGSSRYWSKETASKGSGVNLVEATGGADFITLAAPASVGAAITYTFPGTITDGYYLKTNSLGELSWGAAVSEFDIAADSGSPDTVSTGSTITFGGGTNVNTAVTDNLITINLNDNITVSGVSTFSQGLLVDGIRIGIVTDTIDTTAGKLILHSATGIVEVADQLNIIGDLDVTGNVYIGGTTVTLRGEDVFIENKDIVLGYTTSITPNDNTANHAGVAIASTEGSPLVSFSASGINTLPDTYKQLMWFKSGTLGFSTDAFAFNYGVAIGTTTMADGVRFAVGTGITFTDTAVNASTGNFGDLNVSGTTALSGNVNLGNSGSDIITVVGVATFTDSNVYIDNQLYVGGLQVTGGASIVGEDLFARHLNLSGIATVAGLIDGNGGANISGGETILSSATVSDLTSGRVVLAGASGSLQDSSNLTFGNGGLIVGAGGINVTGVSTFSTDLIVSGDIYVSGNDIRSSTGNSAITLNDQSVTINGDLYVSGSTTQVNTTTLTVEDSLIELAKVDGSAPASDLNIDVGILLHYYDTAARLGAVYWDDSAGRIVLASRVGESSGVLTVDSGYYADVEFKGLYITDTAGAGQAVVSYDTIGGVTGRHLQNIIVDGGTF